MTEETTEKFRYNQRLNDDNFFKKIGYKILMKFLRKYSKNIYRKIIQTPLVINVLPRPVENKILNYFKDKSLTGCEIGVLRGDHSESMLKFLNIQKLYLIDIWEGQVYYNEALNRFKKNNKVQMIRSKSENAYNRINDNELDFIYIDGNHTFDYVYKDLSLYKNKVKNGGLITGHDINRNDVLQAVIKFCNENDYKVDFMFPDFCIYKE
jgi:hypothetical protein